MIRDKYKFWKFIVNLKQLWYKDTLRGGLFIRKKVTNFSTSAVIAQNGYFYQNNSFEDFTFNTSSLSNGDSFIISQSDDSGGPYSFTNTVASKTTIKSGIDGKFTTELSYIFKWDDKLNVLTFFMKNE